MCSNQFRFLDSLRDQKFQGNIFVIKENVIFGIDKNRVFNCACKEQTKCK